MSENIMLYDAEQKRIDTNLKETLLMVQEYSNKTYEDKTKDCREILEKAKKHRNDKLAYYEDSPKEYKAIKRYGEVLDKVERLLGIIPEPKKEFKLEDLAKKMQELVNSRKKVSNQTTFSYFQNVLTNTITNMLNVERDFQSGAINEKTAKAQMGTLITELRENRAQVPNEMMNLLGDNFDQAMKMAEMYEKSFANVGEQKIKYRTKFVDTDLSERQKIITSELNVKTQTLMANIASLDSKMCEFEPQVDLNELTKYMEKADNIMDDMVFDPDNLDSAVTDIELTTENLTREQTYKNEQSESITSEITSVTEQTEALSKESLNKTADAYIENLVERGEVARENAEYVQELVKEGVLNEDIVQEINATANEQLVDDVLVVDKMQASCPGVTQWNRAIAIIDDMKEQGKNVQEALEEARKMRNPDYDTDEDENDDKNRRS